MFQNLIGLCPIPSNESYSASKAGLIAFTRSMAQVCTIIWLGENFL